MNSKNRLTEWEYFVIRHQNSGNLWLHFFSYISFLIVAISAIISQNYWILLLALPSQYVGYIGHQIFERSPVRSIDLISPMTSIFLTKIWIYILLGKYSEEIARVNAKNLSGATAKSGKLTYKTLNIKQIQPDLIEQMWNLFTHYYESVSFDVFLSDLNRKNDAILIFDSGDNSLQGFSTIEFRPHLIHGKKAWVLYSGDTIINSEYWGQSALQKAFFRYMLIAKLKNLHRPVYWFLISKGYKTYLLLSRNFKSYWPNPAGQSIPSFEKNLLNQVCQEKFGTKWAPEEGVIRFPDDTCKLKPNVAPVSAKDLEYEDISFFVKKNPEHHLGTELATLGKFDSQVIILWLTKRFSKKWMQIRQYGF